MSSTFKSFQELHAFLNPSTKGKKAKHPAMMCSATIWVDANTVMPSGNVRLVKVMPNGKFKRNSVDRKTLKKYVNGNADGSITVTGRNAITSVVSPFVGY